MKNTGNHVKIRAKEEAPRTGRIERSIEAQAFLRLYGLASRPPPPPPPRQ
jgi:hypothetical protein